MAEMISASRRTDIPHYFSRCFAGRRKAGYAEFRNAFGGAGSVSLRNEDVFGYLFWTKYARPFRDNLRSLRDEGIPYVFQYTVTLYNRDLEPNTPRGARVLDDFLAVSATLPQPEAIQWRYDPIVCSTRYDRQYHVNKFSEIACALAGATKVVNRLPSSLFSSTPAGGSAISPSQWSVASAFWARAGELCFSRSNNGTPMISATSWMAKPTPR